MMHDTITIGSSTIDYFIYTDSSLIKIKSPKGEKDLIAYPSGSKLLVKKLIVETGGGGTNTAATFSRFGLKTGWLGVAGNDEAGKKVIAEMKKFRVDFLGKIKNGMTGTSFILDSIEHDRTVLTYKGVNDEFNDKDIDLKKIECKLLYLTSLTGKSFSIYNKILPYAKKHNAIVVLNPSAYLAGMGAKKLSGVLKDTDILICNDEEAALLVGKSSLEKMSMAITWYGPKISIITLGKKGVFCYDKKYFYNIKAHHVRVAESLGAGDAFGSAFSAAYLKTKDIELSLRIGLANAESVIQKIGAKKGILSWDNAVKMANKQHEIKKVMVKNK